eukprot:m.51123 g.51123  ORF g.51123 m.51123 type:complete len:179 (+) comp11225_c0_seq1:48-584(+)
MAEAKQQHGGWQSMLSPYEQATATITSKLEPLLAQPHGALRAKMSPIEVAKLDLTTAFTINSLFWTYLAARGVDPKTHPVKKQLDRIKSQMLAVRQFENPEAAAAEASARTTVDKEAAARVIKRSLSGNDRHSTKKGESKSKSKSGKDKSKSKGKSKSKVKAKRSSTDGSGKSKKSKK